MKNKLIIGLVISILYSCNQQANHQKQVKLRIDSLENKLQNAYKPGLGEFMTNIQIHHAKLWFAGQNQNWKLADFEVHEIMETVGDIQQFETERKESKMVGMISPALDSVNYAIQQKNPVMFANKFIQLTNTCNNCHRAVNFEFNVVKIPDSPPFSNQEFK